MHDRERPIRVTPEGLENWLRTARLRAAEAQYLAMHPNEFGQSFVLSELSAALSDAMEELRVLSEELRNTSSELQARSRSLRSDTLEQDRPSHLRPESDR